MAVTAAKLREVSALLIDMHTQHQQQTLLKKAEHMKLLEGTWQSIHRSPEAEGCRVSQRVRHTQA